MELVTCYGAMIIGFVIISLTEALIGNKRPLKTALFGMIAGLLVLITANSLTAVTGNAVQITPASILISSVGGVPGALLTIFAFTVF